MKTPVYFITVVFFMLFSVMQSFAQNSVGVNTTTPNKNAVLELVSPNNNQGLLIPKLTTVQRTASTFTSNLTSLENGLLVFDVTENIFYFWQNSAWQKIGQGTTFTAGSGINIDASNVISATDNSATNEIQDLTLTGNQLTLSNDPTPVLLSAIVPTDGQVLKWNSTNSRWEAQSINGNVLVAGLGLFLDASSNLAIKLNGTSLAVDPLGLKINASGVTTAEIANNSVTGTKIQLGSEVNGNIMYYNGTDWVLLPQGTTGQYLQTQGASAVPVWNTITIPTYTAGTGINIDATNTINSLWTSAGSDVILANSVCNVAIGGVPNASYKFYVYGKLKSNGIDEISDQRFKTKIRPIESALNSVMHLNGIKYNWNTSQYPDKNFSNVDELGLIAQDVEKIVPELVTTDQEGYKSVSYSHTVALLIEAMKEQQKLIEQQSEEIKKLKQQNERLISQDKKLEDLELQIKALSNQMSVLQQYILNNSK